MINKGEKVRLKSGGPLMRVIDVTIDGGTLLCEWDRGGDTKLPLSPSLVRQIAALTVDHYVSVSGERPRGVFAAATVDVVEHVVTRWKDLT